MSLWNAGAMFGTIVKVLPHTHYGFTLFEVKCCSLTVGCSGWVWSGGWNSNLQHKEPPLYISFNVSPSSIIYLYLNIKNNPEVLNTHSNVAQDINKKQCKNTVNVCSMFVSIVIFFHISECLLSTVLWHSLLSAQSSRIGLNSISPRPVQGLIWKGINTFFLCELLN